MARTLFRCYDNHVYHTLRLLWCLQLPKFRVSGAREGVTLAVTVAEDFRETILLVCLLNKQIATMSQADREKAKKKSKRKLK